jgi:hypothetical protein
MDIIVKKNTGLVIGLLIITLVLGVCNGQASADESWLDYSITYNMQGKPYVNKYFEGIKEDGTINKYTKDEFIGFFESSIKSIAQEMGVTYGTGNYEIIEINGKPWQETQYRDLILSNLDYEPTSRFRQYPELYEYVQEPKYNGRAVEVIQWVKNEKTKSEPIEDDQKTSNETDNETEPDELEDECTLCDNQKEVAPNKQNQIRIVLEIGSKTVSVEKDGVRTGSQIDNAPFMQNNITYIPVKGVFDKLGAEIDWDSATRTVTIQSDNKLEMVPWSKTIIVDGEEIQVENPAIIVNGRTFLPVRVVAENLNHKVEWKAETREIIIQ